MRITFVFLAFLWIINECNSVRRSLSDRDVARGIEMFEQGLTQRAVAQRLGVSMKCCWTVLDTLPRGLVNITGEQVKVIDAVQQPIQDRFVQLIVRRHRLATASDTQNQFTQAENQRISVPTVRNRLHEVNLNARRPEIRPALQPQHRIARLDLAQNHHNWQLRHWTPVMFSDESRFHLSHNDKT